MNISQSIPHPHGISVFGSALIRVDPDIASIQCSATALQPTPREAFAEAKKAAAAVQTFLKGAGIREAASSRVNLNQEFRYKGAERSFAGYQARVGFHILLKDLNRIEELLSGVVEAGATEIVHVDLQTSRLKELRTEARERAVWAAREKAVVYAHAAGLEVANVLHIEDVNPEILTRRGEGHVQTLVAPEDVGMIRAFDPGSILIGGAVQALFSTVPRAGLPHGTGR